MGLRPADLFELTLLGGAPERRYLALRGAIDLPWESLEAARYPDKVLEAARHTWTEVALTEFASASLQSELISHLVQARAPLDLIGMATRFPLDELVHAELAARVAEALGGGSAIRYEPERLFPKDCGEGPRRDLAARVVDVCVLESCSLELLRGHARRSRQPLIRGVWSRIAKDEATHARFGWLCLEWLEEALTAADRSFLATVATRTAAKALAHLGSARALPSFWFSEVSALGAEGPESYWKSAQRAVVKQAVEPLVEFGIRATVKE